jgi:site-specific recombinase XerD
MTTTPIVGRYRAFQVQKNLAAQYISTTRQTLTRIERSLGVPLEDATEEQLADWYADVTVTLKPETRGIYLAHVAGFYGWLVRERIRADDPTIRLARPKNKRGMPRPISDASLRLALKSAPGNVRTFLILGAYAGLRAGEMAGLHREDIQVDADPPVLIVRDGKGGKQRVVPLHPLVVDELAFLPQSGPLFLNRFGDQIAPNSVSARVGRHLRSLGLTESLHQCRHAFATNVYRQSLDLRLTQELCGHADPKTTARYAAWAPARAAAVVGALPTVGELRPAGPIEQMGNTRRRIHECVREYGSMTSRAIADATSLTVDNVRHAVRRMVDDGQLDRDGAGHYWLTR